MVLNGPIVLLHLVSAEISFKRLLLVCLLRCWCSQ